MKRVLRSSRSSVVLRRARARRALARCARARGPAVPALGNGGYDVQHYDLDLRYATSAPAQSIDGTVTILARATQDLSRFDLDFAGQTSGAVASTARPAKAPPDGEDLVITPSARAAHGRDVHGQGLALRRRADGTDPEDAASTAFFLTPAARRRRRSPTGAHLSPATTTRATRPRSTSASTCRRDHGDRQRRPAPAGGPRPDATSSTSCASRWPPSWFQSRSARYDVTQPASAGVFLRDATHRAVTARMQPLLGVTPAHLDWMQAAGRPLPVRPLRRARVEADLGFALETQTLELIDTSGSPLHAGHVGPDLVHELSHAWFGDSVSPYDWSDLWLNEGHASWYEFLYAEEKGFLEGDTEGYPDDSRLRGLRGPDGRSTRTATSGGPTPARSRCRPAATRCSTYTLPGGALVL